MEFCVDLKVNLFTDCICPFCLPVKTIMYSEMMNINLTFRFEWQ